MVTLENLLPPQAPEMKVGRKSEHGKHHSLPQAVLLSTYDNCRVCADPRLQNYALKWQSEE